MKNIILGIIGVCVILYTFLVGVDILRYQTSKNKMDKHISRIVENVLEGEYQVDNTETVKQLLIQEIINSTSEDGSVTVEVKAMDLEKGLLSVRVTKQLALFNGKQKKIVVEKTAIIERSYGQSFKWR